MKAEPASLFFIQNNLNLARKILNYTITVPRYFRTRMFVDTFLSNFDGFLRFVSVSCVAIVYVITSGVKKSIGLPKSFQNL